jgi:hypothetical protein
MPPQMPPLQPVFLQSHCQHCVAVTSTAAAALKVPLLFDCYVLFSYKCMGVVVVRKRTTGDDVSASIRGGNGGMSGDAPPATRSLVYKQGRGGGCNVRNAL